MLNVVKNLAICNELSQATKVGKRQRATGLNLTKNGGGEERVGRGDGERFPLAEK